MSDSTSGARDGEEGLLAARSEFPELLKEIVGALPVGVCVKTSDGALVYANQAATRHGAHRLRRDDPVFTSREAQADRDRDESQRGIIRSHMRVDARTIEINRHMMAVQDGFYDVTTSADVTDQLNLEDELFRRAYFDEVTGLPNGGLLEKGVKDLIEGGSTETQFALAFIDIDNFKHINDYYGRSAGDELLVRVARRIADQIRPSDMLARFGGDEFVLLFSPTDNIGELKEDVQQLSERLKEPFFIDGHELFTSASIGVSLFPMHGKDYQTLRAHADTAMYRTKNVAKGGVGFFESRLDNMASARAKLEQRLRLAIRDRRLSCAFQPKVDFRSHTVVGLEVLLRWRDEEGVFQAPGDFVNLAVELGLMDDITRLVLAQTVEAIDTIDDAFGPHTTISLNVAAKQAEDFRFMRSFADALEATTFPERFMVELTEEAFLLKSQFQTRVLPMLRDIGAKISIDDFGAGYSSLSALADITADEIKVDRSFITQIHQRPRNQSLLAAIESLGSALGMSVIVEGVETIEELTYLEAETGIRYAQGYYFARPMSFDEIAVGGRPFQNSREVSGVRENVASRNWEPRTLRRNLGRAF
jgi:diguanylate cyclase (GGDEF)-like protein